MELESVKEIFQEVAMRNHRWISLLLIIQLLMIPVFEAEAYQATTLRPGMRGEAVAEMQQALIDLGYL